MIGFSESKQKTVKATVFCFDSEKRTIKSTRLHTILSKAIPVSKLLKRKNQQP